ncbi:MAG: ABC transporter permease, partial [Chitinophagaceae bacterium]
MLRNYFKIAFRNIIKNKMYSTINVMGLAIGMAGFILIAAWIWNERSYDQFHENKSTVYKVWYRYVTPGYIGTQEVTAGPLAKSLKDNYPEIKNSSRIFWSIDRLFNYEDKNLKAKGNEVDKAFLQMFSFPLVKGDANHVLDDINSIVITEDLARKIFGTENPINKVVKIDNKDPYKVTGVLKNLPKNTSFDFEYLVSLEANEKNYGNNWNSNSYYTFVQTQPGVSADQVNKKIKDEVLKHEPESRAEIFLHPMSKWHLYSRFENGKIAGGRIEIIQLLLIIG